MARSVFSSFFSFSRKGIWSRGENPSASTSESNPGYFYLFSYLWHLGKLGKCMFEREWRLKSNPGIGVGLDFWIGLDWLHHQTEIFYFL